jgi:excisionase family DNA binding protein
VATNDTGDDDDAADGRVVRTSVTITDLNNLPALLTVEETAAILRTTTNAIYTMASRSRLPGAVHIGRRLLVRRSELLQFLNEGRVPPPARSR